MGKRKVMAFIDGFNLYHSIDDLQINNHLKWLDIWKLCESSLNETEKLIAVKYFTAYTEWNRRKVARHKIYIRALESSGVEIVRGRFAKETKTDINTGNRVEIYEEKETDINIAISLINHAVNDDYDQALVITADSDQVPTLEMVRNKFEKEIRLLIPMNRRADELKRNATFHETLSVSKLESCLFPDTVQLDGDNQITKPENWNK